MNLRKISSILSLFLLITITMSAQSNSSMNAVALRLKPGEDLKKTLEAYVKDHQVKAACIITCCGSLTQAAIRYADKPNTDTIVGKFEILSVTGTLSENGSHLHLSIADGKGNTIGGHLKEGSLIYTTAEIVIGILPDLEFERETDSTYGFKELKVVKLKK